MRELLQSSHVVLVPLLTAIAIYYIYKGRKASTALWTALSLMVLLGVIPAEKAFAGFSSDAFITISLFMIFSAGLESSGVINILLNRVLSRAKSESGGLALFMALSASVSVFLNNTLVVVTFLRPLKAWAERRGFAASHFLIPLSYSAIVGGLGSIIGTSTNLTVVGAAKGIYPHYQMGFWDIGILGLPITILSIIYMVVFKNIILPKRTSGIEAITQTREYSVEYTVQKGCDISGKSIEVSGLRNMSGLYLAEIFRAEQRIIGPSAQFIIQEGDQLLFVGAPESLAEIRSIRGLEASTKAKLADDLKSMSHFYEAVIAPQSHLVDHSLKAIRFRENYGAVVLAILRNGKRVEGKLGTVKIEAGDVLLLESERDLVSAWSKRRDFFFVSRVAHNDAPAYHNAGKTAAVGILCLVLASTDVLPILEVALIGALLMLFLKCVTFFDALRSMDKDTLLVVAASSGLGAAFQKSGIFQALVSEQTLSMFANPVVLLVLAFVLTSIASEFMSNNAAGVLGIVGFLPLVQRLGLDPHPFVMAVMVGASTSYLTSYGYQTNLMVKGVGGYKESDFFRAGIGISFISLLVIVVWGMIIF